MLICQAFVNYTLCYHKFNIIYFAGNAEICRIDYFAKTFWLKQIGWK